jgi:phage terminase large subunit
MGEFKSRPVHDWSSHAADAFRYLATALKEGATKRPALARPSHGKNGWLA